MNTDHLAECHRPHFETHCLKKNTSANNNCLNTCLFQFFLLFQRMKGWGNSAPIKRLTDWHLHLVFMTDFTFFFLCTGVLPPAGSRVIAVLGDPINVRSFQRHFSNIYSGARGRFLRQTCRLYKAVKMIKVPFRNPEREGKKARVQTNMQTDSQTGGDGV